MFTIITILPLVAIYAFTLHIVVKEFNNEEINIIEDLKTICKIK